MLDYVINEKYKDYKCYDLLKKLYNENPSFKKVVDDGISLGKVSGYSDELFDKLDSQNIRSKGLNSFLEVLKDGANLGYCTVCAKQVSYSFDSPYICGGTVDFLIGTINSIDGRHTWILNEGKVIDTTLMIIIDSSYINNFGYHEENRYNPLLDPIYVSTKDFTNDTSLNR